MLSQFFSELLTQLQNAKPLEWIGVIAGIASVWFSKRENILVYPVGLINTIIYIFISAKGALFGEAAVNLYYTIVSIYGWWLWALKKEDNKPQTPIAYSSKKRSCIN
jgi:nicotinamide mononucleotide transporter